MARGEYLYLPKTCGYDWIGRRCLTVSLEEEDFNVVDIREQMRVIEVLVGSYEDNTRSIIDFAALSLRGFRWYTGTSTQLRTSEGRGVHALHV